jgi:DNA-binding NtrC family response regulator
MASMEESVTLNDMRDRIIIIDDDQEWCTILSGLIRKLGYDSDLAHTVDEAKFRIAENDNDKARKPYLIAILDMNFETGKSNVEMPRGKEMLEFIKNEHPYIACIMISGAGKDFDEILDLRDNYDLDYYLAKERVEIDKLSKALAKARQRSNPLGSATRKRKYLQDMLEKWEGERFIWISNLGESRIIRAKEGLQASIHTINQIKECETELLKVEKQIAVIKEEIEKLT